MVVGLSFGVKLMPGVRVRVGTHGIRTSVGPRVARVHVGGRGIGASTGVGPVSLYGSLNAGRRRSGSSRKQAPTQAQVRAAAQAERHRQRHLEAYELDQLWRALTTVHHAEFEVATRPSLPATPVLDAGRYVDAYEQDLVKGLSRFARAERRAARERAIEMAAAYAEHANLQARESAQLQQRQLDQDWELLVANDPATVMSVLAEALADNDAVAAPVEVSGDRTNIVLLAPSLDAVPERGATRDKAGNWTTKKLTAAELSKLYLRCLASNLLATAMETFAVAPSIQTATIAVIRNDIPLGAPEWKAYIAARFEAPRLMAARYAAQTPAEKILDEVAVRFRSNSARLLPLREVDVRGVDYLLDRVAAWTE